MKKHLFVFIIILCSHISYAQHFTKEIDVSMGFTPSTPSSIFFKLTGSYSGLGGPCTMDVNSTWNGPITPSTPLTWTIPMIGWLGISPVKMTEVYFANDLGGGIFEYASMSYPLCSVTIPYHSTINFPSGYTLDFSITHTSIPGRITLHINP